MKCSAAFIIAALSFCTLSDASATFYDGNKLIPMMREFEKTERHDPILDYQQPARFSGYVTGVADALLNIMWCPGRTGGQPSISQLTAIVAKYLNGHPDQWHLSGDQLVATALKVAFPCPKSE